MPADEAAAIAAVEQRHHTINNKTAEVKFAVDRGDDRLVTEAFEDKLAKQIFVGGLPKDTTPDELKEWAGNTFGHDNVISAIVVRLLSSVCVLPAICHLPSVLIFAGICAYRYWIW